MVIWWSLFGSAMGNFKFMFQRWPLGQTTHLNMLKQNWGYSEQPLSMDDYHAGRLAMTKPSMYCCHTTMHYWQRSSTALYSLYIRCKLTVSSKLDRVENHESKCLERFDIRSSLSPSALYDLATIRVQYEGKMLENSWALSVSKMLLLGRS